MRQEEEKNLLLRVWLKKRFWWYIHVNGKTMIWLFPKIKIYKLAIFRPLYSGQKRTNEYDIKCLCKRWWSLSGQAGAIIHGIVKSFSRIWTWSLKPASKKRKAYYERLESGRTKKIRPSAKREEAFSFLRDKFSLQYLLRIITAIIVIIWKIH